MNPVDPPLWHGERLVDLYKGTLFQLLESKWSVRGEDPEQQTLNHPAILTSQDPLCDSIKYLFESFWQFLWGNGPSNVLVGVLGADLSKL